MNPRMTAMIRKSSGRPIVLAVFTAFALGGCLLPPGSADTTSAQQAPGGRKRDMAKVEASLASVK